MKRLLSVLVLVALVVLPFPACSGGPTSPDISTTPVTPILTAEWWEPGYVRNQAVGNGKHEVSLYLAGGSVWGGHEFLLLPTAETKADGSVLRRASKEVPLPDAAVLAEIRLGDYAKKKDQFPVYPLGSVLGEDLRTLKFTLVSKHGTFSTEIGSRCSPQVLLQRSQVKLTIIAGRLDISC